MNSPEQTNMCPHYYDTEELKTLGQSELIKIIGELQGTSSSNDYNSKSDLNDFLEESFNTLTKITNEHDFYNAIGETLSKIIPDAYILLLRISNEHKYITLKSIHGIKNDFLMNAITVLGFNPIGKKYEIKEKYRNSFFTDSVKLLKETFSEFASEEIPRSVSKHLGRLLKIQRIYNVGLIGLNALLGNIHIFHKHNEIIEDWTIVERFLRQASRILERNILLQSNTENENRYRLLSGLTYEGIFIHKNGIVLDCNDSLSHILGYECSELIGKNIYEKFLPLNADREYAYKNVKMDYQKPYRLLVKRSDGTLVWVEVQGRNIHYMGENVRLTAVRDIRERVIAEEEELETKKNLEFLNEAATNLLKIDELNQLYDYIGDSLLQLLPESIVLIFKSIENGDFLKTHDIFGLDDSLLMKAMHFLNFDLKNKKLKRHDKLKNIVKNNKLIEVKEGLSFITSQYIPDLITNKLEKGFHLNKFYVIGIHQNNEMLAVVHIYTRFGQEIKHPQFIETFIKQAAIAVKRKMADIHLRQVKEEIERLSNQKSIFMANLSHEVRTPLNSVLGFTDILLSNISDSAHRDYLKSIKLSSNNLLQLLNDLLDFSKIEANQMKVHKDYVNVCNVLEQIIEMYIVQIRDKGLELKSNFEQVQGKVFETDELKLRQIFTNLISNAIKFTETGYISISADFIDEDENTQLIFVIEDTGVGIPEEHYEEIFEPFKQYESHNQKKYGGTGLGLAITKKLVLLLNGTIQLDSVINKGSRFEITFSGVRYINRESDPCRENYSAKSNQFKEKIVFDDAHILVVDDIENNRKIMKNFLEKYNFEISEETDGKKGLNYAMEKIPDLVFMDISMPVLDGIKATKILKKNILTQNIPVISTSSYQITENTEATELFDEYLTKPIKEYDVLCILKKYIHYKTVKVLKKDLDNIEIKSEILQPEAFLDELENVVCANYQVVINSPRISDYESFGKIVRSFVEKYNIIELKTYIDDFDRYLNMLDLVNTTKLLKKFPDIKKQLQEMVEENGKKEVSLYS